MLYSLEAAHAAMIVGYGRSEEHRSLHPVAKSALRPELGDVEADENDGPHRHEERQRD